MFASGYCYYQHLHHLHHRKTHIRTHFLPPHLISAADPLLLYSIVATIVTLVAATATLSKDLELINVSVWHLVIVICFGLISLRVYLIVSQSLRF